MRRVPPSAVAVARARTSHPGMQPRGRGGPAPGAGDAVEIVRAPERVAREATRRRPSWGEPGSLGMSGSAERPAGRAGPCQAKEVRHDGGQDLLITLAPGPGVRSACRT